MLIADLDWLSKQASNHSSVDTLAKKFYLMGERKASDLKRLKIALSMFFVLEQTLRLVDIRYDTFFASILTKDVYKFPKNIRILSWNYDYQFEKAFSEYCDLKKLSEIQKILNVVSKGTSSKRPDGFAIVKLNGTTSFSEEDGKRVEALEAITVKLLEDTNTIDYLTNYYAMFVNKNCKPDISFAWENEGKKDESIVDKAMKYTQDTEILVTIGYSFPFFNREVDRKIIGAMTNLKKVYFQDTEPEKIKTRFQAVLGKDPKGKIPYPKLVAYPEVGSFLLPDEL